MGSNKPVFLLILAIILAILAVIFSLQNDQLVDLKLFGIQFKMTLALALLLFLGAGALFTFMLLAPRMWTLSNRASKFKKAATVLEDEKEEVQVELERIANSYEQLRSRAMNLLPEAERELFKEEEVKTKKGGFFGFFGSEEEK